MRIENQTPKLESQKTRVDAQKPRILIVLPFTALELGAWVSLAHRLRAGFPAQRQVTWPASSLTFHSSGAGCVGQPRPPPPGRVSNPAAGNPARQTSHRRNGTGSGRRRLKIKY
jgi:hypothetical protein